MNQPSALLDNDVDGLSQHKHMNGVQRGSAAKLPPLRKPHEVPIGRLPGEEYLVPVPFPAHVGNNARQEIMNALVRKTSSAYGYHRDVVPASDGSKVGIAYSKAVPCLISTPSSLSNGVKKATVQRLVNEAMKGL